MTNEHALEPGRIAWLGAIVRDDGTLSLVDADEKPLGITVSLRENPFLRTDPLVHDDEAAVEEMDEYLANRSEASEDEPLVEGHGRYCMEFIAGNQLLVRTGPHLHLIHSKGDSLVVEKIKG